VLYYNIAKYKYVSWMYWNKIYKR
jgi:hypothetical protein